MTWDNETGHGVASGDDFDDSFDALLGQADDDYDPEDAGGEMEPLPDGKYQVKIDTIEITRSKKSKRMLKWQFKILNGNFAGRLAWKYSMMDSAENAKFLIWDLKKCGVNARSVAGLKDALEGMINMKLEISVKTKAKGEDSFQNIYINKKLSDATVSRPDTVNRQGDADYENDTPF